MDNKRDETVFEAVAMSTFDMNNVSHDVRTVLRALSMSASYMNVVSQYNVERDGRVIGKFSVTRKRKTKEGHMLFNVILVDLHKNVDDCISTHILYCSNPFTLLTQTLYLRNLRIISLRGGNHTHLRTQA